MKLSNQSILWAVLLVVALFIAWNSYQSLRYQSYERLKVLEAEYEELDAQREAFYTSGSTVYQPAHEQDWFIPLYRVGEQIKKERRFLGLPVEDSDD